MYYLIFYPFIVLLLEVDVPQELSKTLTITNCGLII